nr:unnamed protein product [Callosobruchus chinensis]
MVHTSNLNDGYSVVQNEINRLHHDLAASRGYRFSPTKTCCVHFCRLRSVHVDPHLTLNGHYIAVRPTVKLLGIVFDCKLNWKDHIDHLVIRCRKVLNLIKCMARIRWGADREILIRIYQALIESRLSYASIVYGSARRSKIKELERLQLAAVRAATGAFRTSPTVAVLCEASIMPLHLKIGQQTLMYEAKIKHLPHHINSVMFNYTNEFAERPSATRPARVRSLEFAEKCGISTENILQKLSAIYPPWTIPQLRINLSLSELHRDTTPNSVYISHLMEAFHDFESDLVIYTDGSKTQNGVGAAIVAENREFSWTIDKSASIFTAESFAIWQALLFFRFSSKERCVIATDSLSVLRAAMNRFTKNSSIQRIVEQSVWLELNNKQVHFIWIPSHKDISGNERADQASDCRIADGGIPIPVYDVIKAIKLATMQIWQNEWDQYGGHLKLIKSTVAKCVYPKSLTRHEQVILCRLRIGHTNLTHLYMLSGDEPPNFQTCGERLTVQHIILCCPTFQIARHTLQIGTNLKTVLSTKPAEVEKLLPFLRNTRIHIKI